VILVDTSVWVDHLRSHNQELADLLDAEEVLVHPFVIGELACGNIKNRREVLALLHALPTAPKVDDDEILFFIERHSLMGRGLGLVDMHLLASTMIAPCLIWTRDKPLKTVAKEMAIDGSQRTPGPYR
jgi:predicted nucleic acid-binding protein